MNHIKNRNIHWLISIFLLMLIAATSSWGIVVKPNRLIKAVVLRDFPPLYQVNMQGKPVGFAIDILAVVARKLGWNVDYLVVDTWEEAVTALRDKRADLIPVMDISDSMQAEFLFSIAVETIPVVCFIRDDNKLIYDCTHLQDQRVAAIKSSDYFQKLEQLPGINLIPTLNEETALFQLANRSVDLFVAPYQEVLGKASAIGMDKKIKVIGQPFMELKRYMMLSTEQATLVPVINTVLKDMISTAEYQEKFQYWYGKNSSTSQKSWYFWWLMLILFLAGGGIISLQLLRHKRREVELVTGNSFSLLELLHHKITGWIVLVVSIILTIMAWHISNMYVEKRSQDRFDFKVEEARLAIQKRMHEYEQVLRGGVGLFNASDEVTRTDWYNYVTTLQIDTFWPGIQGIGFSLMLAPDERGAFIWRVRAEGYPAFDIQPPGERSQYSSILYLEPLDNRNMRAFGYDMFSESIRHAAMEQARDSGLPALSGRVTLVQETKQDVQIGFLMYLPVYKRQLPTATVLERRAALLGFVYSPFRTRDLMEGILGHGVPDLDFEIFDGTESVKENLLYSTRQVQDDASLLAPHYISTMLLDLPGRTWLLRFTNRSSFEHESESSQSMIVALLGMMIDLLLFVIVLSLSGQKERIQLQAQSIAKELNKADIRYRRLVDTIKDVIFQLDKKGCWAFLNPAWEEISGYKIQDSLGQSFMNYLQPNERLRAEVQFEKLICGQQSVLRDAFCALHHSGKTVWVEVYALLLSDEDGKVQGVTGTLRDITLQKEFETVMVQTRDAAESANRAKSEFLANMSHELRTPLNSLLILSQLLANEVNLTSKQMKSMQVIHESGQDLLRMINDILDLSKVEAGRMEVMLEAVSLEVFLRDLRDQFLPLAQSKALTLELSLAEDLPVTFITDRPKLGLLKKYNILILDNNPYLW